MALAGDPDFVAVIEESVGQQGAPHLLGGVVPQDAVQEVCDVTKDCVALWDGDGLREIYLGYIFTDIAAALSRLARNTMTCEPVELDSKAYDMTFFDVVDIEGAVEALLAL